MKKSTITWVCVGMMLALLSQLLVEHLWVIALAPIAAWAGVGITLVIIALWRLRRPEQRRVSAFAILAIVVGAVGFVPMAGVGGMATTHLRFRMQRDTYDRVVATALAMPRVEGVQNAEGLRYMVDRGRVAFAWPGGIIDNWCGAVYDPTAEVMKSSKFNGDWSAWREPVPGEVISLFGGDLVWCKDLERPYFFCCFT